jgi:hypothetical protein
VALFNPPGASPLDRDQTQISRGDLAGAASGNLSVFAGDGDAIIYLSGIQCGEKKTGARLTNEQDRSISTDPRP